MKLKRPTDEPEIPTASMADIAFLLIVFFMLTSVFAETRGINFSIPPKQEDEDTKESEKEEAVQIKIDPAGRVIVDNTPLERDRLGQQMYEYLKPKLVNWPEKPILVTAEESSPYGSFVEAYDALRRTEEQLQKERIIQKMKVTILSLAEIKRLKEAFGEDIFG